MRLVAPVPSLVLAVAALALCFRPEHAIIDRPLVDDAYYSFAVARHIALGHGVTIDGEQATNGFQPLFTFLCVLPQWLSHGDRALGVRLTLLLCWSIFVGSALLFGAILKRLSGSGTTGFVAGAATYGGSMYLLWQHFSGLETGFMFLGYLTCWWWLLRCDFTRLAHVLLLGVLLGLLVLIRLDAIFFVAALALLVSRRAGSSRAAILVALSAVVSAPWWLYCYLEFGSFMPSSGAAQHVFGLSAGKLGSAVHALAVCLMPLVYLFGSATLGKTVLYLTLFALASALCKRAVAQGAFGWQVPGQSQEAWQRSRLFLGGIVMATVVLLTWYTYSSGAVHFYRRYFAPLSLVAATVTALVVDWLARESRRDTAVAALVSAPALGLCTLILLGGKRLPGNSFLEQVELVARHVPAGDVVGAFQSGTLGYFRDGVVNLDGKVNPQALRQRGRIGEYVEQSKIRWLCDWPEMLERLGTPPERRGFELVARGNGVVLYGRAAQ